MCFQERSCPKDSPKKESFQKFDQRQRFFTINPSAELKGLQKTSSQKISTQAAKKISDIIVSLHSKLVQKLQDIEIYRDLTQEEQNMLKTVQNNELIHIIFAGTLAIESCFNQIQKQETNAISTLMKGLSICLGRYKKLQAEYLYTSQGKLSQYFVKFYDSLKFIATDIHKLSETKITKNQINKNNEIINSFQLNTELLEFINKQQNILISILAQQNNSLRQKITDFQKKYQNLSKQNSNLQEEIKNFKFQVKKKDLHKSLTESSYDSLNDLHQQNLIRQLKDEILQKNNIIVKINEKFASQINKIKKLLKQLEEENKLLKRNYGFETVNLLESLEEVQKLRLQKHKNQNAMNEIMNQINNTNKNNIFRNTQSQIRFLKPKFDLHFNPSPNNLVSHENRISSQLPSTLIGKRQCCPNRYFSPTFDPKTKNITNSYVKNFESGGLSIQRNKNTRFSHAFEQNVYESIKEKIAKRNLRRALLIGQRQKRRLSDINDIKKSSQEFKITKNSGVNQNLATNKLRRYNSEFF